MKIRCIKMELGEPDASGRRRPIEVPGSEFELDVDCVIMALGTSPNPLIKSTTKGLEINKKGGIVVRRGRPDLPRGRLRRRRRRHRRCYRHPGHGRRQDCCQGHRRGSQQVKNPIIKKSCRIAAGFFL